MVNIRGPLNAEVAILICSIDPNAIYNNNNNTIYYIGKVVVSIPISSKVELAIHISSPYSQIGACHPYRLKGGGGHIHLFSIYLSIESIYLIYLSFKNCMYSVVVPIPIYLNMDLAILICVISS